MLEKSLGIVLGNIPTVDDDIIPACCSVMGLSKDTVDFCEMSNFWGKHEAFRLNTRHMFKHDVDTEVVLLDDAVFNEHFSLARSSHQRAHPEH